ncbi:MAG TPA: hypothetical protein ENN12_00815, partial [Epsilonproteobacteria bacterium]|nr:hypothetical protein [Campylobacterota bacterium]
MRIVMVVFLLVTMSYGRFSWAKPKEPTHDELIMRALWHEERLEHQESYEIFKKLYRQTGAKAYLFRKIELALVLEKHLAQAIEELHRWNKQNPSDLEGIRLLLSLYLTQKDFDLAKEQIELLMSKSQSPLDIEIGANSWLYVDEPEKAARLLDLLYKQSPSDK